MKEDKNEGVHQLLGGLQSLPQDICKTANYESITQWMFSLVYVQLPHDRVLGTGIISSFNPNLFYQYFSTPYERLKLWGLSHLEIRPMYVPITP